MFSTAQSWSIHILLPAAAFTLLLPANEARAQGRLQSRQGNHCQHNGNPAQLTSRQQANTLRNVLRSQLQQLNALQQTGQLNAVQLQAASQLQSALQQLIALQQLAALQNSNLTLAQLQMLAQQRAAAVLQLAAGPLP